MSSSNLIEQIGDRIHRLLLRHQELQRTNALLEEQLSAVTRERDNLKSRLLAARTRIDELIDRLPENRPETAAHDAGLQEERQ